MAGGALGVSAGCCARGARENTAVVRPFFSDGVPFGGSDVFRAGGEAAAKEGAFRREGPRPTLQGPQGGSRSSGEMRSSAERGGGLFREHRTTRGVVRPLRRLGPFPFVQPFRIRATVRAHRSDRRFELSLVARPRPPQPLAVLQNWANEIKRFTPGLTFVKVHGSMKERDRILSRDDVVRGEFDLYLTT